MTTIDNPLIVPAYVAWDRVLARIKWVDVALDIGCNDGGYFYGLLEHARMIHAFDPIPSRIEACRQRFPGNDRIVYNQVAVSDAPGHLDNLAVLNTWSIGHIGQYGLPESLNVCQGERFSTDVIVLDDYVSAHALTVGFIKLDVDGYEPKVWRGAHATLQRDRPPVFCELSYLPAKMGDSIEAFIDDIVSSGYTVVAGDTVFRTADRAEILRLWPWHTSFDVMLVPTERLSLIDP